MEDHAYLIPVISRTKNHTPVTYQHIPWLAERHPIAVLMYQDGSVKGLKDIRMDQQPMSPCGIMLDPPARSVTDVYTQAAGALHADKHVLVLYVDGLGYGLYLRLKHTLSPFIQKKRMSPALCVYPPVTNPNMASMLTGVLPPEHGVHSRKDKRLLKPSLLALSQSLNKRAVLVEGDIAILQTEIPPILNAAPRSAGDQAVYACARRQLSNGADLTIAHFHGLDDLMHQSGPVIPLMEEKLSELCGYFLKLCEGFSGRVILSSDHGGHTEGAAGSHGSFTWEDMLVPFGAWDWSEV